MVDTDCTRRVVISYFNQMKTTKRVALQLDPNRRDGEGRLRMDGGVEEEGKMRQGRKNEARQGGGREGRPFERGKHSRRRVPA